MTTANIGGFIADRLSCENQLMGVTHVDEVRADCSSFRSFSVNTPLPILPFEPDCFPSDLLDTAGIDANEWWLLYAKSRHEKKLMRRLRQSNLRHFAPQVAQRRKSPAGRVRTSYVPLFSNYVFLCGAEMDRYQAVCTGYVQKATEVTDVSQLLADLRQIRDLIQLGVPLTIESRLQPGQQVRVKSGSFAGYEGVVLRREQETRLLVSVRFMEQGVSVKLDDCQLEPLGVAVAC